MAGTHSTGLGGRLQGFLSHGIAFKISLGPILGALMVVVLVVLTMAGLQRGRSSVMLMHDNAGAAVVRGQEASTALLSLQSGLFQLTGWLLMKGKPEDVERMKAGIAKDLASMTSLSSIDPELLPAKMLDVIQAKTASTLTLLERNPSLGFQSSMNLQKRIDEGRQDLATVLQARDKVADEVYASVLDGFNWTGWTMLVAGIGQVVVLVAAALFVSRSLTGGISRLTSTMTTLAEGSETALQMPIPGVERSDEIGDMARAVVVFRDGQIRMREAETAELASRQQKERHTVRLESLVERFRSTVSGLVENLSRASQELETTAGDMSTTAARTKDQASSVAHAASEASHRVQSAAAAAEQLNSSIAEISRNVDQSSQLTGKAVQTARQTDTIVRSLTTGAQEIGTVVGLINAIAAQTNLLALNATIEAARAGEAGRGFSVVATEVKSLAHQTAEATGQIRVQVERIQANTRDAVEAIEGIANMIEEVNTVTASIASAIEEQQAATSEIFRNVQEAAASTQSATHDIADVTDTATVTGYAASKVLSASSGVSDQAAVISKEVGMFISEIRAA